MISATPGRRKTLVANWKLNGHAEGVEAWLEAMAPIALEGKLDLVLMPPALWMERAGKWLARHPGAITLGAQNVAACEEGAYTGEISASMLARAGARYALIGHSERRRLFGETDEIVSRKLACCLAAGLTPVLCIGETEGERRAGETDRVLERQLAILDEGGGFSPGASLWIAYEPVWSIGTGQAATPELVEAVLSRVRSHWAGLNATIHEEPRLLYGGSVSPANAASLVALEAVDGLLVGGASVEPESCADLCRSVIRALA
jgi:triosephosphate isomerase